jgi:hypothetical protein
VPAPAGRGGAGPTRPCRPRARRCRAGAAVPADGPGARNAPGGVGAGSAGRCSWTGS